MCVKYFIVYVNKSHKPFFLELYIFHIVNTVTPHALFILTFRHSFSFYMQSKFTWFCRLLRVSKSFSPSVANI